MRPPRERNGAFTVTAAGTAGLTRDAARTRRFVAPSQGVRYPADHPDPDLARASAALIGSRESSLLAGLSAARIWQLPLPPWIGMQTPDRFAVAVAPDANRPRRKDVRGCRVQLPPQHVTRVQGLAVTTPARTWLDCSQHVPIAHLIAMGDAVLARRLATSEDLGQVVRWARRRRGVVNARMALPLLDPRSGSPGESLARAYLVLAGLARPCCNLDIVEDGEWLARADLAWPAARLIVEYDGIVHLTEAQRRRDAARRNLLQAAGWHVITLTAADLARPALMVDLVASALRARLPG